MDGAVYRSVFVWMGLFTVVPRVSCFIYMYSYFRIEPGFGTSIVCMILPSLIYFRLKAVGGWMGLQHPPNLGYMIIANLG